MRNGHNSHCQKRRNEKKIHNVRKSSLNRLHDHR
jgi:hypothetical protein